MTRAIAILRPEPANGVTAAQVVALGLAAIRLPLFAIAPLPWIAPAAGDHDALFLTSANTLRHGGAGLETLRALPVLAVGGRTADAARAAGFTVALTGTSDAAALAVQAHRAGFARALHLGGRESRTTAGGPVKACIAVYAGAPLSLDAGDVACLEDTVVLVHSARAAARLAALVDPVLRASIRLAALSAAVLEAAGKGWQEAMAATVPTDSALLALGQTLAD